VGHQLRLSEWVIEPFSFPDNPGGNQVLDLNSEKELTYKSGTKVKAVFQVSPKQRVQNPTLSHYI
jgi:hypothetical protein